MIEVLLLARLVWLVSIQPEWAVHPSNVEFWVLLALTLLAFLARRISAADDDAAAMRRALFQAIFVLGVLEAALGILQDIWIPEPGPFKTAMLGTIGSANGYGTFLALAVVSGAVWFVETMGSRRIAAAIGIGLSLIAVAFILNGSRGALLGLACAGGLVLWTWARGQEQARRTARLRTFVRSRSGIPVLVGLIALLTLGLTLIDPASSAGRPFVWRIVLPMVTDYPLTGVGPGRFGVEYLGYQARFLADPDHAALTPKAAHLYQAHSEYLQAFAEGGIVGGLLFLAIWGTALLALVFRSQPLPVTHHLGLLGLLTVVLAHAVVDNPLHVLPVATVTYTALGLSPTKMLTLHRLPRWAWRAVGIAGVTLLLAGAVRMAWQYPSYRAWARGEAAADALRWADAVADYEAARELLPQKGELLFHLGAAYTFSGSFSRGIVHLERSLDSFADRNVHLALAWAYLRRGDMAEAERAAEHAAYLFPDHLAPHLLLGEIYYALGDVAASQRALRRCIERRTHVLSPDVEAVARDASALWLRLYGPPLPNASSREDPLEQNPDGGLP